MIPFLNAFKPIALRRGTQDERPPVIAHFGQHGEIPGGMAQVLNEYLRWDYHRITLSAYRTTVDRRDPFAPFRTLECAAQIIKLSLKSGDRACVIHMSQGGSFVREGFLVWIADLFQIPVAIHMHGSRFAAFAEHRPRLVRFVLRKADAVLSLTTETAEVVRRLTNSGGQKAPPAIAIVPNAVSVGSTDFVNADSRNIVMAGVLGRRKGVDVLLKAWSLVDRHSDGWKLQLVGPRSDDISDWPDIPGIEYVGIEDHKNLLMRLEQAEIAVLVARDEALPMFILESMARGCCVISTPVGQIPDLVTESTGSLVPVGDVDATANTIRQLIDNPEERRAKARSGRALIEKRYSEQSAKPILEELWWRLASKENLRDAS